MTYEQIRKDPAIRTYISQADASLKALGYTEHSFAHVTTVAERCEYILKTMGYPDRLIELSKISAFLHDIGNLVNRVDHSQSGAVMAFRILDKMGFEAEETAMITTAIGNHDEGTGVPVSPLAAALIIADKSDVRRSRVRNTDPYTFDAHDRVNYSVTETSLRIDEKRAEIILELSVNTDMVSIMDYFEIFLERMIMCRKAAQKLGLRFRLIINDQRLV